MTEVHRDYIDSFEENKNGLMALKKAIDLGGQFQIQLDDGSTISIASPLARHVHDVLVEVKPQHRDDICKQLMGSRATFIQVVRMATATKIQTHRVTSIYGADHASL